MTNELPSGRVRKSDERHTRGPWAVVWDEEDGWNHHIYSSPTDRVCFMAHGGYEKQGEFDANARLIAAAPDLLEALEEIKRTAEATDTQSYSDNLRAREQTHRLAREAIAKATKPDIRDPKAP